MNSCLEARKELNELQKALAKEKHLRHLLQSRLAVEKQVTKGLKVDVEEWRQRASDTLLAFAQSTESFTQMQTAASSSHDEEGDSEDYKPHII